MPIEQLVSVACVVSDKEAKVVIGGVFIIPYRANKAESMIKGERI